VDTTPSAGLQSYALTKVLNKLSILNEKNCRLGLPEVLEVVRVWSRLLPRKWDIIGFRRYFVIEK
jgi:hypothetical protein